MPSWDVHFRVFIQTGNSELVSMVAKAHALASVIRGIPIPPYLQDKLDTLNIVRAVRGTTGIEGVEVSEEEVREILEATEDEHVLPSSRAREEKEVRNATELMYRVSEILDQEPHEPITERLIQEFHSITTAGIDYPHNVPGKYRSFPVRAGAYSPPQNGEDVRRLMQEFIAWFYSSETLTWDPVIRAIVAHFYVVSIHPFGDGNGRTSRAVESYLLYQARVNPRGFYSLSNYYYKNRDNYIEMLNWIRFRSDPDLTPFVIFALRGLVEQLEEVHAEVLAEVRLITFRDFAREALSERGRLGTPAGRRQLDLLYALGGETFSLKDLRSGRHPHSLLYRNVTNRTLMRDVKFLKDNELLVVEGDFIRANLETMTRYTALQRPSQLSPQSGRQSPSNRSTLPMQLPLDSPPPGE